MIDYKNTGVDIQAGDDLVSWLQKTEKETNLESSKNSNSHSLPSSEVDSKKDYQVNSQENSPSNVLTQSSSSSLKNKFLKSDVPDYKNRVVSGIGGFAALFDGRFSQMTKPLLVSCTDGVGTKVKLASYFNDYSTVGQDMVAMCVNDLICTGGTPLFFLDYYAVGKLNLPSAQAFLSGVRAACEKSHLVLIGGETAEMPGVYQTNDFDCAGFTVGVVDEVKMWGPHRVLEGDVILGLESSGFHSNGYSLLRKVFESEYEKYRDWLMKPTELYVEAVLNVKADFEIHAAAHITGGGVENIPRVLPDHLKAKLKKWDFPECFAEVQRRTGLSDQQMLETLNCGIGFVLILPENQVQAVRDRVESLGIKTKNIGVIVQRKSEESHVTWD